MNIPDIDLEPPSPRTIQCKDCCHWRRVRVYKDKRCDVYDFGWCPIQEDYFYEDEECQEWN